MYRQGARQRWPVASQSMGGVGLSVREWADVVSIAVLGALIVWGVVLMWVL